jgi:hypothetical protein
LKETLDTTWHPGWKHFLISDLEVLLGNYIRLGEAVTWVYHLRMHMYNLAAFALKESANFLGRTSPLFVGYLKKIKDLMASTFKHSGVINANTIAELSFAI